MMRLVEERLNRSPPARMTITLILIFLVAVMPTAYGWSNGGYSADPNYPDYGTHDFLAHHALDWVPDDLDFWLRGNVTMYLYGTELPDNVNAPLGDGIGDTRKHHVYYRADGSLQDDVSARRAQESYDQTLAYLAAGDYRNAAKWMGIASHYVVDLAVFGHVMGADTDWGAEKHHSDYENWVNGNTNAYNASFKACLGFNGKLEQLSAYDAALKLAHDTTFDDSGKGHSAKWVDENYNPADAIFQRRVCESINFAVNLLADVIYSVAQASGIPEFPNAAVSVLLVMVIAVVVFRKRDAPSCQILIRRRLESHQPHQEHE